MFKPLLRTMPSLSGNLKLTCELNDYTEVENHIFEANVRTARLNAISSQLASKVFNISLLQSSYEWDVRSFYKKYNDIFYKRFFDVNQRDLTIYDESSTNLNRNTDFEFGVKRISFIKNGKQFCFFAPIYIESENDIPDYFEITINLSNNIYKTSRKIRINCMRNINIGTNYLGRYLYEYAQKINSSVVYLDKNENRAIYYGIDVIKGGFSTKYDTTIGTLFNNQHSILNFDNLINKGFERNKLIIKQIIPLAFLFSVNDILSDVEKTMFKNTEIKISGKWVKNGNTVKLHDFDIDYTKFKPSVLQLNKSTGEMQYALPKINVDNIVSNINIMNMGYPSMRESLFFKYRFSNKITPNFSRWKLMYSNDLHPYITNSSPAFSFYQHSKSKYGEFPSLYKNLTAIVSKKLFYLNLILPLNGGENKYPNSIIEDYENIRNNYCSSWFETFYSIDDVIKLSVDVKDNKAFFNGILYDLSTIYNSSNISKKIDKFGVFINPIFNVLDDKQIRDKYIYTDNVIYKENSKYVTKSNCHITDNILVTQNPIIFSNLKTLVQRDQFSKNRIFVKNEEDLGDFIKLSDYGIDYWKANDFIKISDLESQFEEDWLSKLKSESVNGYDIIPIYRLSNIMLNDKLNNDITKDNNLFVSNFGNKHKIQVYENNTDILSTKDVKEKEVIYNKTLYRKNKFIDRTSAKNILYSTYYDIVKSHWPSRPASYLTYLLNEYKPIIDARLDSKCSYQFNPILTNSSGEIYSSTTFTETHNIAYHFYGDDLPSNKYNDDYNFIWVDPYNINNIVDHYNNTWLKDDVKLSYYADGNDFAFYNSEEDKYLFNYKYNNGDLEKNKDYFINLLKKLKLEGATTGKYIPSSVTVKDNDLIVINALYERTGYSIQSYYDENEQKTFYYWGISVSNSRFRDGRSIVIVDTTPIFRKTIQEAYDDIHENENVKITINGTYFIAARLESALKLMSLDLVRMSDDEYVNNIVYTIRNQILCTLNLDDLNGKNEWNTIYLDKTNSQSFYCKFLDLTHLRFWGRCLFGSVNRYNRTVKLTNSIYIRKRWINSDLTVKDSFIPIYKILTSSLTNDDVLSFIRFDKKTNLFYFDDIVRKDKNTFWLKNIKLNSLEDLWSPEELNGENFESKNLKFELVYKKTMIKVDDNIWKLMNLEEKYAAPYKDLYLYDIETDEEFNKSLFINRIDNLSSQVYVYSQSRRGVLKPLFNIATIQDKDETVIYTEYSINNITVTNWKDWNIVPNEYKSNIKHFYRHNCNNAVIMYDLSTINKDLPIIIADKKCFYKKYWDRNRLIEYCSAYVSKDDYDDEIKYENAVVNYINTYCYYFSSTYDLFGGVDTVNWGHYSTYETEAYITNIYSSYSYTYVSYSTVYDENAFTEAARKNNLYKLYLNNSLGYTEEGIYSLDGLPVENSYAVKQIIPPSSPIFVIKNTTPIAVKSDIPVYSYRVAYTYYDSIAGLYDNWKLNTYSVINENGDSYTYAFYLIDVNLNNTTNAFNLQTESGERVKYISYINGVNLIKNSDIIRDLYKHIVPFTKYNPLSYIISNSALLTKPKIISIGANHWPKAIYKGNKVAYYDIVVDNTLKDSNITLERYFDNIVPVIKEAGSFMSYNIKYKDMNKSFSPTPFTNETIYPLETSINIYPGVRVYDMNVMSTYKVKYDWEWKHFNDNKLINLEERFSYTFDNLMTKTDIIINESDYVVKEIFKEHLKNSGTSMLDETGIDWAFNKYKVEFSCESVSLDIELKEKLYKLEIFYTLY